MEVPFSKILTWALHPPASYTPHSVGRLYVRHPLCLWSFRACLASRRRVMARSRPSLRLGCATSGGSGTDPYLVLRPPCEAQVFRGRANEIRMCSCNLWAGSLRVQSLRFCMYEVCLLLLNRDIHHGTPLLWSSTTSQRRVVIKSIRVQLEAASGDEPQSKQL